MFPLANGETVTRIRRKLVLDPYSQEQTLGSWEDADELDIEGVAIAPSSSIEQTTENRQMITTAMSIYGEPDMDVKAQDRIRARTGLWTVEGENADWMNALTGWNPAAELRIKKVVG